MADHSHYVLVDYENVQPTDLGLLDDRQFKVIVFVGANQKVPVEFAAALQPLGANGGYVHITGIGRNALDFHIAFRLGELVSAEPAAHFHIVSKDKGFDPLIAHLRARKIEIERCESVAAALPISDEIVAQVADRLAAHPHPPRTLKKLKNEITNWRTLGEAQIDSVVHVLERRALIRQHGRRIEYRRPA